MGAGLVRDAEAAILQWSQVDFIAGKHRPQESLMTWDRLQPGRGLHIQYIFIVSNAAFPAKAGPTSTCGQA
ncbi:hypothetical protein AUC60_00425 [Pseudomonas caspiana]|uniref:Uncharacterized protein n=1 Tax=Pseudomonas caspiana TaxID=1451454 RepID=A0A1Y3P6X8_9PSED|nr:hypothetical protein AUC60_00425 [Pseudomonas caspiana]